MTTGGLADVVLRDGRTLRLRPPARDDAEGLLAFFGGLSQRSAYLRFHGFAALGPRLMESLVEPDWHERGTLLGTLVDPDGERVVAVANYVRLRDSKLAEAAFTVADEHQGRGIGTRLLEQLAARAAEVSWRRCYPTTAPWSASSRRPASS
jgi:GNAT superfamily N-acetyltransferase